MGIPVDRLYEEIAFLAYYLHWDYGTLMNMEHEERRRWCEEVSRINRALGEEEKSRPLESWGKP